MRYAKAKLEAAQKQFALQTAAGDLEKAEHLDQEVKGLAGPIFFRQSGARQGGKSNSRRPRKGGTPAPAPPKRSLVPGENLEVFVNEDPSFNGIYQVRRGGYIIMPQVGRIAVAGKSLSAAEAA